MKTFYIGLKDKLLIIKETKKDYTISTHLRETRPNRLAFDPQNEERIYCATSGEGLWRSENGGENWEKIGQPDISEENRKSKGIHSSKVTSVAIHPKRRVNGNHVVYAGTEPSMLYYSEDNGNNWIEFEDIQNVPSKRNWRFPPRPETHFVRWITPSYSNKDYLALSIEAGAVLHTQNHGATWNDRPDKSPIDVHTLLAHPAQPDRLYAANGDGASHAERAYAESHDGGLTWHYMSTGIEEHPYLYNMVLNSQNPEERLVSASKNASQAHRSQRYSTVYRKMEDDPWVEVANGLPCKEAYTHHLAEDPTTPGAYYALNNFGIFYLDVGQINWEKIALDAEEIGFDQRLFCFMVKETKKY